MMVLSFRRHGSEHATLRATQIRGAGYEAEPERAYLVGATDTESPQAGAPTLVGLAEISRIRSGFRLSSRPRWRKSLENRARVFESVQVETYPLPHRSATVIHCRPTTCFCAITLAKRTARCIATGVSSKTADCAPLTPFNAPSFIWARSMTSSKRLGAKALRCSTRPLNGPNKSVYSPRTATSHRMYSMGSKSSCPN